MGGEKAKSSIKKCLRHPKTPEKSLKTPVKPWVPSCGTEKVMKSGAARQRRLSLVGERIQQHHLHALPVARTGPQVPVGAERGPAFRRQARPRRSDAALHRRIHRCFHRRTLPIIPSPIIVWNKNNASKTGCTMLLAARCKNDSSTQNRRAADIFETLRGVLRAYPLTFR